MCRKKSIIDNLMELRERDVRGSCPLEIGGIETREYEWIGSEREVESTHQAHPTSAFVSSCCEGIGRKCPKNMTKRRKKKKEKKKKKKKKSMRKKRKKIRG